ncbi:Hypothetical predicted protein [Cloeon dipterum]|uniref:Uncharacterized protein n=1 Tax=Cloeon dipterum TaxID=197152 RepID=A0A8S1DKQ2_9INSE|nr:Hypothetical predicted protein [Cloeon dipterum]
MGSPPGAEDPKWESATKIEVILNPSQLARNSGIRIHEEEVSFVQKFLPWARNALGDFFALFFVCLLWNFAGMFVLLVIRSRAAVFGASVGIVASIILWTSVAQMITKIPHLLPDSGQG